MNDVIEEAVERVATKVDMVGMDFQLFTGRPAQLAVPADVTDAELLHVIFHVLQLGDQLRAKRASSRLVLPT